MKMKLIVPILLIGIWLLDFNSLTTTVIAANHEEIKLESAIKTAISKNPALKVIREKGKVAKAELDGIALLSNPELESEYVSGVHGEQAIELTKSFELSGQRRHRKKIAKTNLEKINFELIHETQKLIKSVKLAFFQLVNVQEKLKLAKEVGKHNQQMLNIAQIQFETGEISVTQVALANIQLQSATRDTNTLESDLKLAQLKLNGLMGVTLDAKLLAVEGIPDKLSKDLKIDALKSHALANRVDLKSLRLNAVLSESSHRLAKAINIPDLNLGGIAERSNVGNGYGVKLSLPLPLFDRNHAEINASKAQKQVNAAEIADAERQITREVMAAYITLNANKKTLTFYEGDLLKILNENLVLTRSAYELGEVQLLEVILLQNEFVKARFGYLDALVSYQKAVAALEAAIGTAIELVQ